MRAEGTLTRLGEDLARQMAALQSQWEGLAADAQSEAQEEWAKGMAAMHGALTELREAADLAHQNYTGAAATNLEMWRRVQ